jgi:hypothetical protein
MLNDEIEKKSIKKDIKKWLKLTWVKPLITIIESWGRNNLIESK